jgi:hypothetical protein
VKIDSEEITTTATITDTSGDLLRKQESGYGSETRDWTEKSAGSSPEVTVDLVPGGTAFHKEESQPETFVEGDVPEDEEDREYNYTKTTTTTTRTVSTTAQELKIEYRNITSDPHSRI